MKRTLQRVPTEWKSGDATEDLLDVPADPDSDEYWFARQMLSLASTGAMFHGRFVEAHVARLLGAHLPRTGINEWDLLVPGTPDLRVEVKTSTGPDASFKLSSSSTTGRSSKRRRPHVWVFVHASDRDSRQFTYLVASDKKVDAAVHGLRGKISLKTATDQFEPATRRTLLDEVRSAGAA